jgi:signal transduction histidine kinase
MTWLRSLSFRVIAYLVVVQLAGFVFGWFLTTGLGLSHYDDYDLSLDDLAYVRMRGLIVGSIVKGADGGLALSPSPALREEMSLNGDFQFAVYEEERWRALPGSSLQLTAYLDRVAAELNPGYFSFTSVTEQKVATPGVLQTVATPYGRLRFAARGYRFRWSDVLRAAMFDLKWLSAYAIPATLASAVSAWIVVRRSLAPLRAIAQEAARIDLDTLNQRLSGATAPTEILPLVEAMNDALTRLDADAARLRRFTANAAHELRTPVAILIARLDAPRTESFVANLQRDAYRIRNVVEQLLATVRSPAFAGAAHKSEDLVALAKNVVADATLLAIQHGRQIELQAPEAAVPVVAARGAIESVLSNLLDNALRAEPEGGAVIVVVKESGVVAVVDHGPGVAADDRDLIFEPFWRKRDAQPGVGLGLAIARELMTRQGGRIFIEETMGGGATFVLAFRPAAIATAEAA